MKIKTTEQEYEFLILDLITEKVIIVKQVYFISYKKICLKKHHKFCIYNAIFIFFSVLAEAEASSSKYFSSSFAYVTLYLLLRLLCFSLCCYSRIALQRKWRYGVIGGMGIRIGAAVGRRMGSLQKS